MWKILILAALVAVEARPRVVYEARTDVPFIVGGTPSRRGDWPWQLSLEICSIGCGHTCGAVLLSATKGLTAAHCTDGRDGFEVVAGHTSRNNPESGTVRSEVADTTEHPDYGIPPGIRNDVATLDLADSIPTSQFIGYATLIGQGQDIQNTQCTITGWGKLDGEDAGVPDELHQARVTAIDNVECALRMPDNLAGNIDNTQQCVWGDGNRGSCQGDSGGPLNCPSGGSFIVAGVTSWGVGILGGSTCLTDYPSVYARLSTFRNWIDNN